jgi:hypothetical protein
VDAQQRSPDGPVLPYWFVFFLQCVFFALQIHSLVRSYFSRTVFGKRCIDLPTVEVYDGTYDCPGFTWGGSVAPPPPADNFVEQSHWDQLDPYISVLPTYLFRSSENVRVGSWLQFPEARCFFGCVTVAALLICQFGTLAAGCSLCTDKE